MVSRTRSSPYVTMAKPGHNLCSGFSFYFVFSAVSFLSTLPMSSQTSVRDDIFSLRANAIAHSFSRFPFRREAKGFIGVFGVRYKRHTACPDFSLQKNRFTPVLPPSFSGPLRWALICSFRLNIVQNKGANDVC